MPYRLRCVMRTHLGLVRENNEDNFYIGDRLFVVADGMGGHAAGEVASRITVDTFSELDPSDDIERAIADAVRPGGSPDVVDESPDTAAIDMSAELSDEWAAPLRRGVEQATAQIAQYVAENPSLDGMGTTVTGMLFGVEQIALVNVGDSRAYRIRRGSGLTQLTSDDSFVQLMVDAGEITADQAQHHPYRNVVLRAVNGKDVAPQIMTFEPAIGDRYLLCTDGLSDYVERPDIAAALGAGELDEAADRLVVHALEAGAPDNVTLILIDVLAATDSGRLARG